jgi:hypothetical protein
MPKQREKTRKVKHEKERAHKRFPIISLFLTIGAGILWFFTIYYLWAGFAALAEMGGESGDDFWGAIFGALLLPTIAAQFWGLAFWFGIFAIAVTIIMIIAWVKGW